MRLKLKWIYTLLVVLSIQLMSAQEKTISGIVSDKDGPLPGVNVNIKGSKTGVSTGFDGKYAIKANVGDVIVFSYIGMQNSTITVGAQNNVNVTLKSTAQDLEQVVVVGYSKTTNKAFTGTAKVVKAEVLDRKNVTNVSQALAGEIAGVRVITTSGQPGSEATVRVRGIGSVNGNSSPLYVVDGVPYSGNISAINFSDIASTTVLKDASATAIYGSRGANGVIILTTKSGSANNSYIQIETKLGNNISLLPRYDVITSPERYLELSWESLKNIYGGNANARLFSSVGINPKYNMWNAAGSQIIDPATGLVKEGVTRKYDPENWRDYAFQASMRNETNLTMGGGEGKTRYFTSVGYLKDTGYSINSDYERLSTRLNLDSQIRPWLKIGTNIGYSFSQSNNNGQGSDSSSVFWFVENIPSIYPLFERDANGNKMKDQYFDDYLYDYGIGRGFGALTNSISDAKKNVSRRNRHELNLNASFDVKFNSNWTLENRFGAQFFNSSFIDKNNLYRGRSSQQRGFIYKEEETMLNYNLLTLLRFNKTFGDHTIEALVAHESNEYKLATMNASKFKLFDPTSNELNNAIGSNPSGSYTEDSAIESYFGQVNYDYKKTYFLSGTVRRDGSSKFVNNKWGTFGSIGASWIVSNEDFMKNVTALRNLKLKSSYGIMGEQNGIGFYPGKDLYEVSNLNDEIAVTFLTKGNPNLTWEQSKMLQTGVEFSIGKYLDVSIDYYNKVTDNLIFDRRIAPSTGVAIMKVNDGRLVNNGFEFDVTAHVLKGKDYKIDFSINGEIIKNRLKNMPIEPSTGMEKVIDVAGVYGRSVGHSIYDFYMREYAGVDAATGKSTWKAYFYDADGDGKKGANESYISSMAVFEQANPNSMSSVVETTTDVYSSAALKYVGKSAIPNVRGAFTLSGEYKNWSLSAQFLYSLGGYALDSAYQGLMHSGRIGSNNWHKDIENRWTTPGQITDVPRLSNNTDANANATSTRFLIKSDYLALNNLRLGYTMDKEFVKQIGLNALDFNVSGDNLMIFTKRKGFNPSMSETGASSTYNYAPMSTISFGVKAKF